MNEILFHEQGHGLLGFASLPILLSLVGTRVDMLENPQALSVGICQVVYCNCAMQSSVSHPVLVTELLHSDSKVDHWQIPQILCANPSRPLESARSKRLYSLERASESVKEVLTTLFLILF